MALSVFVFVACRHRDGTEARDPSPGDTWGDTSVTAETDCFTLPPPKERACMQNARPIRAWGPTPRELPPAPTCPMRVHLANDDVVAEPIPFASNFDPLPFHECVAPQYAIGNRRVLSVDDGFFVAYDGLFKGELFWASEDGKRRRALSTARIAGFARPPSGVVLALAIGKARLGRGGVLAFEKNGEGWQPRLVATLPVEPSPVSFDDHGVIVGFAQGFVFRVDERGRVENVHYVARPIGRVSSIARAPSGVYFLGVECGVVRLVPTTSDEGNVYYREEWWSSRSGASGRWASCAPDPSAP
jgi:hypothetical protein